MIFISLSASVVVLLVLWISVARAEHEERVKQPCESSTGQGRSISQAVYITVGGVFVLSMGACTMYMMPAALISLILIAVVARFWEGSHLNLRGLMFWSVTATGLVYLGFGSVVAVGLWKDRSRFPVLSLDDRLAYESSRRPDAAGALERNRLAAEELLRTLRDQETKANLSEAPAWASPQSKITKREASLQHLHQQAVWDFINSPGFGVGRHTMRYKPTLPTDRSPPTLFQPQLLERHSPPESQPPWLPSQVELQPTSPDLDPLVLHGSSLAAFLRSEDFGYLPAFRRVAGFQPHAFHASPTLGEKTGIKAAQLKRIDLVSVLKYEQPCVYLTDHLPRMADLRDVPTRPLEPFEERALKALRRGENHQLAVANNHIQMLGAIRAVDQCLKCHDADHGDLLGAFSYKLER